MIEPYETSFTSQRLTLSLCTWGDANQPKLVLVHGGRDQKRSWDFVARHLASRYHVLAYDLRGHGESDWVSDGDYGVMDHVYDLKSLFDAHVPDRAVLMGHSLGGNITVRFAGLFPDKISKLIALEGLGPSPKMQAERAAQSVTERLLNWDEQRRKLSDRSARKMASIADAKARMRAAFTYLPEALIDHLTRTGVRQNEDGSISWAYDPAGLGRSPSDISQADFEALWERITCPTWLVYGADSWASNPLEDGRAAKFKTARVTSIPEAGHWLHHDQFDVFMAGLEQFLAEKGA